MKRKLRVTLICILSIMLLSCCSLPTLLASADTVDQVTETITHSQAITSSGTTSYGAPYIKTSPATYSFTKGEIVSVVGTGSGIVTGYTTNSYTVYGQTTGSGGVYMSVGVKVTYIVPFVESYQEVTCTINPSYASNKAVTWSLEWSATSNTNDISDYLTLTIIDSDTVRITNIKDLAGQNALLICTSNEDDSIYAQCYILG